MTRVSSGINSDSQATNAAIPRQQGDGGQSTTT